MTYVAATNSQKLDPLTHEVTSLLGAHYAIGQIVSDYVSLLLFRTWRKPIMRKLWISLREHKVRYSITSLQLQWGRENTKLVRFLALFTNS